MFAGILETAVLQEVIGRGVLDERLVLRGGRHGRGVHFPEGGVGEGQVVADAARLPPARVFAFSKAAAASSYRSCSR